ncbi:unnamed protein product [Cylicocyclus nassatus]|uniref:G-protein coupled receptors family 1 profile domain-containing protein n=1 Tax=Cylicocyclus nassatus TaxID=53992 RepID=A0AA36GCZ5_CYLNA|nr:unnamed protein product [Cylicocyclus nassatus]
MNATSSDIWHACFMSYLYIAIGIFSTVCSVFSILVICSKRNMFKKYPNLLALNMCELIDAISYILTGFGRASGIEDLSLFNDTTVYDCFFRKYWPHALILGTQLPAFCLLLVTCERLLTVFRPMLRSKIVAMKSRLLLFVPIAGLTRHRTGFITRSLMLWTAISALSTLFVSLPSALMLGTIWIDKDYVNDDVIVSLVYITPGVFSVVGTVTIFAIVKDLRQRINSVLQSCSTCLKRVLHRAAFSYQL